uniref:Exocyst complex component 5 n=1 Tax=Oncorhynchus kisutch TaxID=8019 RepID=A0A8C7D0G9_ONCKI
ILTPGQLFISCSEPFDADEYIERLAWRTPGGGSKGGAEAFDPKRLLEEFENHIEELKHLDEKIQRRVEKLEHQCHREAKEFAHKVQDLQRSNQVAFQHFQELDEHISYVATKVCHLGDQLEGVNTPRQRAVEAQRLMTYFNEFLDGELRSDVFNNPEKIKEAADIIQKLHLIAQELPFDRFADVKAKIASECLHCGNHAGVIVTCLCFLQGYAHCVDVYIKQCQEAHVKEKLDETRRSDVEQYLKNLYDLYTRTTALASKLTEFNLGSDKHTFLSKLIKNIFSTYLESYIEMEKDYLRTRSAMILQRYYDSKNHQKRPQGGGSIQELKERIRQRTNLPLGPSIDTHGETFLSQEVVVNLLQETRHAFERCNRLSDPSDLPKNAFSIFLLLVEHLCMDHIDYALEIGLSAIPSADAKNANLYFLDVVQQANTIFHLFDKQFNDHLMPLISSSPKLTECLHKKKEVIEQMEVKLDTGIDRTLNCMVGQMKHILATEQKKTDFRPEDENNVMIQCTAACSKVCVYVSRQVERVRKSMDGKNVDTVLTELGVRFHRLIHEHLQQYSYSSMGGMLAICDVAEYRKSAKDFRVPLVLQLFDTLHALCNLLVVAPDNLKQVCSGEQLTNLDRNLLHAFVQLRVDYRQARLGRHFS